MSCFMRSSSGHRTVLLLDPQVAEALDGQTLDVEQGEDGPVMTVQGNE